MRLRIILTAALLSGCTPAPAPVEPARPDPAKEAWYGPAVEELAVLNREAESLFRKGKLDEVAAIIAKAQPLMSRLLSAPRPTLSAMEAVSDVDDLYGRMLLANRHYGWARLFFQKNVARWRSWKPQSDETTRRRKLAESRIADCDRGMLR